MNETTKNPMSLSIAEKAEKIINDVSVVVNDTPRNKYDMSTEEKEVYENFLNVLCKFEKEQVRFANFIDSLLLFSNYSNVQHE